MGAKNAAPCDCHSWVVFSTAMDDGCLMLSCTKCGAFGIVPDPTKEEWSRAFHTPANPYPWYDNARVRLMRRERGRWVPAA